VDILNVVCVGQFDDLPFSADDPAILLWAERQGRILITEDKTTMPAHDDLVIESSQASADRDKTSLHRTSWLPETISSATHC
jgi:hypothetical protein